MTDIPNYRIAAMGWYTVSCMDYALGQTGPDKDYALGHADGCVRMWELLMDLTGIAAADAAKRHWVEIDATDDKPPGGPW